MNRTRMTLALVQLGMALSCTLASGLAVAQSHSTLSFDAPAHYDQGRAVQLLAQQALANQGLSVEIPAALTIPVVIDVALETARAEGSARHFHLSVAPLREGALLSLEEARVQTGETVFREAAQALHEGDFAVTLERLARSVLARRGFRDSQTYSSITAAEGVPHGRLPGEFLWGLGVTALVAKAGSGPAADGYGSTLSIAYAVPNFTFGWTGTIAGREDSSMIVDTAIFGEYYFMDANWSPYLGASLGYGFISIEEVGDNSGMLATARAGVEAMRFHRARIKAGLEFVMPFFSLQEDRYSYYWGEENEASGGWRPITRFTLSVHF